MQWRVDDHCDDGNSNEDGDDDHDDHDDYVKVGRYEDDYAIFLTYEFLEKAEKEIFAWINILSSEAVL